ncbi:MAG: hypothetical protein JWR63_244 [Conexibacter sp.]|nr:hypothetical protein [Conexibacter sp.]
MALVYLVLAHGAPEQVAKLVGRISSDEDTVIVHVDRKADLAPFAEAFARLPIQPLLTRRRFAVHWGGWGIVQATVHGMRTALALPRPWSHLVLLSGADYPIRSTAEIQAFFAAHAGASFLSWSAGDGEAYTDADRAGNATWRWTGDLSRMLTWQVSIRGRRWYFPSERVPYQLPRRLPRALAVPYQGSAWWSLTPEATAYCVRYLRRHPSIAAHFRFVFAPDENVFQMMLLTSPLRDTLVNEDLRFMHWAGNSPPAITAADVPAMRASRKLFARKFDLATEPEAFAALDAAVAAADAGEGAGAPG